MPRAELPYSSVLIKGDSHTRDLAKHVRRKITRGMKVEGVCKPEAGLLDATSQVSPPLGSCCVIVAGTNDVASGQQRNIYRHLEDIIRTKLKTSSVVVSTLPHRHDLPTNHQINQEIVLVNHYIEELCARYRGAGVLDFNRIGRSAFTLHGMHFKPDSKHLLVECLQGANRFIRVMPSPPPASPAEPSPTRSAESPAPPLSALGQPVAAGPHMLHYESFAEAVKIGSAVRQSGPSSLGKKFPALDSVNPT
ncbi:hypothetical protein J6590_081516 [Homalodisca vitripennis]|nr:hypothetical protein J6590_081516 [Homalodisca vitripennis]